MCSLSTHGQVVESTLCCAVGNAAISTSCHPPGRIKVLGVQAATDSYIYTFRGFSISRFVECTRLGLTPRRCARHSTANNVGKICICQKLRRRLVRARLPCLASKIAVCATRQKRIPRILMLSFDCKRNMSLIRAPTDFRLRLRINGDELS